MHGFGGMRSLAIAFPSVLRTNDYWRELFPELIEAAESHTLARLWAPRDRRRPTAFDRTMQPYSSDPFRGAVERRIRAEDEPAWDMEIRAARAAIEAAGLGIADIDLALVSSFVGDRFGVGNAAYVAERLGLSAPAWNFESACSSSVVGLHMAATMVGRGPYRRILVISSTSNSVQVSDRDTIGWFVGDGAGAFVVEPSEPGFGVLGWQTINSIATNDMFVIHSVPDELGSTRLLTGAHPRAGAMARETAEPYLRACVDGALARAERRLADVDFWVFNTPNAWYSDFCAEVLGVGPERHRSVYPRYANIGAALMPATLYHALADGLVGPGQIVGMYSVGSTSTANALIMRIADIGLGPAPERPSPNLDVRARIDARARANETLATTTPELPAVVHERLERIERTTAAELDEVFVLDHHVAIGPGRRLHLREHFCPRAFTRTPRRAIMLLAGPATVASFYNLDVDGYRFADTLARRGLFCFSVDMEGSGESVSPLDGRRIDHARMLEGCRELVAYIQRVREIPKIDVLGESNGGAVAAALAADERVRSCILASMVYAHGTAFFNAAYQAPGFLASMQQQPHGYLDTDKSHYQHITMVTTPEVRDAVLATQPGRYPVGPLLAPANIPWFDPGDARAPALIIQGTDDDIATQSDSDQLAADYGREGGGRATIVRIPDAAHIPRVEPQPAGERFTAAVLEWLG